MIGAGVSAKAGRAWSLALEIVVTLLATMWRHRWTKSTRKDAQNRIVRETATAIHYIEVLVPGGALEQLRRTVQGLHRSGFRQVIMCSREPDMSAYLADIADSRTELVVQDVISSCNVLQMARLARTFRRQKADVIHFHLHSYYACRFALLAAVFAQIPALAATELVGGEPLHSPIRNWLKKIAVTQILDCVVVSSRSLGHLLTDLYGVDQNRVILAPNCVDVSELHRDSNGSQGTRGRWGLTGSGPHIGVVARLHRQKGHSYLLQAVRPVIREFPGAIFLLIGDGPLETELRALVGSLHLNGAVRFLGFLSRAELRELYTVLDLSVLPSLWEGTPLAVLDAMAMELPVVATAVDGTKDTVEHGVSGLLVPPRDSDALAEAILEVLRDRTRAKQMGIAARQRVIEFYSLETYTEKIERAYRNCTGG